MMALSMLTEDFTSSDDYEEGEILDEDSLYDDISSLEDLSLSDSEPRQVDISLSQRKRKKEHKCKEGSVCRGERSGKHCFARIRKRRLSPESVEKAKTPDHTYHRRPEEGKILDKKNMKRMPIQSKYIGRKLNRKDQFVKEGYHFHKQKNYDYYKEKTRPFRNGDNQWNENDYKSKHKLSNAKIHNSFVCSAKPAKTSLLKRLVGSGSMVAKKVGNAERQLLQNEDKQGKDTISDYADNIKQSNVKIVNCSLKYDVTSKQSETIDIKELTGEIEKSKSEKTQSKPKSEELNEWDLRIAALRTALLKKFSEKKKNGLSFKRKCSNPSDDSIVDYALQDFVENEMEFPEKVEVLKDVDYRQFSEQQPCDIEFCEMQPVQHGFNGCIFTEKNPIPFSETDFDCRVYSCYPFPQGKIPNSGQKHLSPILSPPLKSDQEQIAIVPASSISSGEDKTQAPSEYLKEINSNKISNQKNSFKKKRRKISKSLENRKLKRSLESDSPIDAKMDIEENEKETTEEEELRELALMSVKVKNKMPQGMLVKVNPDNELLKTLHVDTNHIPATNSDSSSNKPISNSSSRDPWDDVDEDILRAQLLSSMTNKIPNKITNPSTESISPNIIPSVKRTKNTLKVSTANNSFKNALELQRMKENKSFYNHKRFIKKNNPAPMQISAPVVQKLVINLNDSDSSEEDCSPRIAASIDFFLQQVRSKTEREQENAMLEVIKVEDMAPEASNGLLQVSEAKVLPNADTKVKIEKPELLTTNGKISHKNSNDSQSSEVKTLSCKNTLLTATSKGIERLPAWQQEEYFRLKDKLLEKERIWKSVELKIEKVKNDELKTQDDSIKLNKNKGVYKQPLSSLSPSNINKGRTSENVINQSDTVDSPTETSRKKQCLNNTIAKESWQYCRDFSELSSMVEGLEKDLEEFQALKINTARLRRELALAQNKMLKKRMCLVMRKESLEKKEKYIKSKLTSEFPKLKKTEIPDQEKQRNKEFELASLKLKEISLRAQLACFNLSKELKPSIKSTKTVNKETSSPLKKKVKTPLPKDPVPVEKIKLESTNCGDKLQGGNNQKRVFSVSESGSLDPFTPLCPFDMAGVCKDEECKYQHIRPT